ncbi:MAG TPA: hypothetical protein VLE91_00510 [Candidatus Saccharimonadales bacterium]|nr:hypothetical protein [Candidatus Saccharimonadales bacterium]
MQNKVGLIAGAVVVVAIIGAVAFTQMHKKSSQGEGAMSASPQSQASMTSASLKDIFTSGKNTTCKFSYPDNSMSGTVYVSGGKVRNEFTTNTNGKVTDGTVIYDGTYAYYWSSSSPQAMKFKISNIEDLQKQAQSNAQAMDMSKQANFDCSSWSVDNSKFVPPTNVTFTDLSEMMQKATGSPSVGGKTGGVMCDGISDPAAKAACMQYAQ